VAAAHHGLVVFARQDLGRDVRKWEDWWARRG